MSVEQRGDTVAMRLSMPPRSHGQCRRLLLLGADGERGDRDQA